MTTDPDSSFAGWFLASRILNRTGREAEALELARVSLAHDPYMPAKIGLLLQLLEATGQSGEADGLYRQSGRWWPNDGWIDWARMAGIAEGGDFKRLAKFAAQISNPNGSDPVFVAVGAENLPQIRNKCQSAQDLEGVVCMMALARLGDLDSAFAIGNRLYPSRHGADANTTDRIWLQNPDPNDASFLASTGAAPLRRDPRFLVLADRTGLLAYWRSGRLPDFCTKAHEPECAAIGHLMKRV